MYPPRDRSTTAAPGKDLYQVLNVARKASRKEIQRAYRDLARKYHPDLNPGNEAAAQRFREIQEAYEVLSDARTRKAYDYYGSNFEDRVPVRAGAPSSPPSVSRAKPAARAETARNAASIFETPQFYRALGGDRHLTPYARLGSVTVALVFVIGTFLYLLLPDSGVREFQRAKEALQHVTSWKMQSPVVSSNAAGSDYFYEVSCPSSARTIQHLRLPGPVSEMTVETVMIGFDRYMYNDRAKAWSHDVAARGPADACDNLHRALDAPSLPALNRWLGGMYVIEKQKLRDSPDGDCREWRIVGPGGYSAVPSAEFVCLGVKDHLPRFQGVPGSTQEVRFYDWNVPVEIVAPDLSATR